MIHSSQQIEWSATAPPAEAFPEWPMGWYVIARSQELTQKPVGVELFGRRLVCFRSSRGKPIAMDAQCWHMGADLSQGEVIDDQIECPFHGWQYAASGRCVHIPSQLEVPICARQQIYVADEVAGYVFVFYLAQSKYPLPFFAVTNPADLVAAPPFEFIVSCPWYLIGANGFDLQHFSGPHNRRLSGHPVIECVHHAARRILATFDVCGENWKDKLTRRFAGRRVTMDVTVWSGTLAFVMAHFHDSANWDGNVSGATSYGMTEIRPSSSDPGKKSWVRVTIFRKRRTGLGIFDQLDVRTRRYFIHAFLMPDTLLLNKAQYDPERFIDADREMVEYFRWLATASRNHFTLKEPT